MAIGCEDVSARMMELLYGELAGEDRAVVEAHLAGCASCRAELATFQGTRAAARRALDADAPPARAHDAILRAAAAAVAARKPQPIQARPATPHPTFWERLRGRWTLPTFATVGAVAVVVLASRVFLEPEKTVELGRQTVAPLAKQAPRAQAIAEAPEPAASAPVAAAAPAERERMKVSVDREKRPKREVAPHAAAPRPATAKKAASPAASAPFEDPFAAPPSAGQRGLGSGHGKAASEDALDGLMDERAGRSDSLRAAPAAKPAKREFAPPPPPRAQPAPAPAARAGEPRVVEEDDSMEESPAPRVGGAGVPGGSGPPPAARARARMKKGAEEEVESAAEDEEEAPAPPHTAQAEKRKTPAKNDKPVAESPVAQADRLFAEGRWAEAARAYRELLRSDPRNADASRWRQRLAAAEAKMAAPPHAASKKPAAPP